MPHEQLPKQTLFAKMNWKSQLKRPQTRWLKYVKDLGSIRLKLCPSETQSVLVDRELWWLNLELLPQQLQKKRTKKESTSSAAMPY